MSEEPLSLGVIAEVGPGGTFIDHPHPAAVFRREFFLSDLLERANREGFGRQELRGLEERARQKARKLLRQHHPEPLSSEQRREIDRIARHFAKRHGG